MPLLNFICDIPVLVFASPEFMFPIANKVFQKQNLGWTCLYLEGEPGPDGVQGEGGAHCTHPA
jgi:hypothetical protein